ncbi:MAG: transcriptional regulator NrdR [Oscillospiraceae bacterium]|nr:transcriptional regulator NrdR [Oscillospiraceae bacterium]
MKCPNCGCIESKVLDSRPTEEGGAIRRRRECLDCQKRFTTYERIENIPLIIVKKDKSREVYDRSKLLKGIMRACEKRPVSASDMERIVNEIESTLNNNMQTEVSSSYIGELLMEKLKKVDEVAYIRFASVYRQFKDINTFMDELKILLGDKKQEDNQQR